MLMKMMVENAEYDREVDYAPYAELDKDGRRVLTNLLSGNWAWRQAVSFKLNLNLKAAAP